MDTKLFDFVPELFGFAVFWSIQCLAFNKDKVLSC